MSWYTVAFIPHQLNKYWILDHLCRTFIFALHGTLYERLLRLPAVMEWKPFVQEISTMFLLQDVKTIKMQINPIFSCSVSRQDACSWFHFCLVSEEKGSCQRQDHITEAYNTFYVQVRGSNVKSCIKMRHQLPFTEEYGLIMVTVLQNRLQNNNFHF